MSVDVSIIVASHDRFDALLACLESVSAAARQAAPLVTELLIVCNASPNDTPAVARAWSEKADFPVRVFDEPWKGASRARNLGMDHARGRILVITDDDCRLAPSYISEACKAFARDDVPTLRGGRVELGDPADLPLTVRTDLHPSVFAPPDFPGGYLLGCNFALTRSVIEKIGYFDTRFGPGTAVGAAEDTDYLFRAWKAGLPVVYDPRLVVYHHHGRTTRAAIEQLARIYNRSDGAFYVKHALSSPALFKNLYWDLRNALWETAGGPLFNETLRLRHSSRVLDILVGAVRFLSRRHRDDASHRPRGAADGSSGASSAEGGAV